MRRFQSPFAKYSVTLLITAMATLGRYVMIPWIGYRFALLTYWPAVEIIAYFFGFRPALISIGLSLVLGRVLFMRPLEPLLFPSPDDVISACLFVLFNASMSMFMESLREARAEAEANSSLAQQRLEQLQQEMDGRQRERNWSDSVLASIGEGVVAADGAGNVTYLNQLAEKMTGWARDEAKHQPLDRVFFKIDEAPYPLLSSTDGRMIPIEHSQSTIKDRSGNELGKVLVFRDVSERRKSENELSASETRLHSSLLAAGAAAWEWNMASGELVCSWEFRQLTGLGDVHPYVNFQSFLDAVHEDDRFQIREELASAALRGAEFRLEFRMPGNTEMRWLALMGKLAAPERMAGIVVEITERRRLEEKLRNNAKQESLGVLSAGIAHDFNNLLTSILGNASLLKIDLPEGSPLAEYAVSIEAAGARAAYLTRQMLAYSGQGRTAIEVVDLTRRVRKVVETIQPSMRVGSVLELELNPELPGIQADLAQVDQVLSGILQNAVEALGERDGRILVSTFYKAVQAGESDPPEVRAGRYIVYEVRDTGCGMDDTTKSRIFDPFFSTKFTGRGLGLAAALGIMRGHGGAIYVESAPGVGSIFQVFWPVASAKLMRARGIHISE